jgi:hypothetical protein
MIYFYGLAGDSADSMTMMDEVTKCMVEGMGASVMMSLIYRRLCMLSSAVRRPDRRLHAVHGCYYFYYIVDDHFPVQDARCYCYHSDVVAVC